MLSQAPFGKGAPVGGMSEGQGGAASGEELSPEGD